MLMPVCQRVQELISVRIVQTLSALALTVITLLHLTGALWLILLIVLPLVDNTKILQKNLQPHLTNIK
jgi:hypothetical protein